MSKMTDSLRQWIQEYKSGRTWFYKLNSEVTRDNYLRRLNQYCKAVGKNPDELIVLKEEGMKHIGEAGEWQAEELLEEYLTNVKMPMNMKAAAKTAVFSFYKRNRRPLDPETATNVEREEPKKRCPKTQELRELENAMTTQRDKALVWFIASASIRDGTTLPKLQWKDLRKTGDKEVPFYMKIESSRLKGSGKGRYKGIKQVAFLHSLAAQKLRKYRAEAKRRGYLLTAESPIFISYRQQGRIKPMSQASMEQMFANASLAAWHDLELKRFSPKDLRDYVQSALENAGVNRNIISPMLAHKVKGVDKHYSEHSIEDFLGKFKKALPYLLPLTVEKLKAEQEEMSSEITENFRELNALKQNVAKIVPLMKIIDRSDDADIDTFKNLLLSWFNTQSPEKAMELSGKKQQRILQINVSEEQAKLMGRDLGRIHMKNSDDEAKRTGFKEIIIQIGKPKQGDNGKRQGT